ncbi:MAG: radical SAM protein [Deltaproteobacteria bacterium]|jgi:radical SAM superfamily enzyme YgiQ (UPF0313 family)|nr:radical SAM protein [Deltaproteobacteria bacterium]
MSSLGYLWVYRFLAHSKNALGERFFALDPPEGRPVSLESGRPLSGFELIAASLVLENDYWLLPAILERAGISPYRKDRTYDGPLVIAGGVGVWSNPWPVIPFVDLVLVGEGENQWPVIVEKFNRRDFLALSYLDRLRELSVGVPGALVPSLIPESMLNFLPEPGAGNNNYNDIFRSDELKLAKGQVGFGPCAQDLGRGVKSSILKWPFEPELLPPSSPILTEKTEFPQTTLVEISRGCPWGCRFCLAGHIYRPHRPWSSESILKAAFSLKERGGRVGLVSSAVADHPELGLIIESLVEREASIGLSSMRLSALTEKIAGHLSRAGLNALAVAPEAGSQRLRDIINKNLSESEILSSARLLSDYGLKRLKLYFMIGLPEENDDDLRDIARLVSMVHQATRIGRKGPKISVSLSNFTPKPQTPFEDWPLLTEEELRNRGQAASSYLAKIDGVEVRLDPPKWTIIQGLLAKGGPEAHLLLKAQMAVAGRPGAALKMIDYSGDHPIHRFQSSYKPWRLVEAQVGQAHLAFEADLARQVKPSPPCPPANGCGRCLACD